MRKEGYFLEWEVRRRGVVGVGEEGFFPFGEGGRGRCMWGWGDGRGLFWREGGKKEKMDGWSTTIEGKKKRENDHSLMTNWM